MADMIPRAGCPWQLSAHAFNRPPQIRKRRMETDPPGPPDEERLEDPFAEVTGVE